jgi:hypothetical protein
MGKVLNLTWSAVRWGLLAVLIPFEPLVRLLLAGAALLIAFAASFLALVLPFSRFPLFGMLATAGGCVVLLALYHALLRALA